MKKRIWILAILLGMQGVALADQPGKYARLVCRDDDPFVFCTQGCKGQDYNWKPVGDPTKGGWQPVNGYCPIPVIALNCQVGPYRLGRDWTQTAYVAWFQYMEVCKWPHEEGKWEARDGQGNPEDEPYSH